MNDTYLVKHDRIYKQLQEAHTIPEIRRVVDAAETVRIWARRTKADTRTVNTAVALKIRGYRKLGEALDLIPRNKGGRKKTCHSRGQVSRPPNLKELGVSRNEASKSEKILSIPEPIFESKIAEVISAPSESSTAAFVREIVKDKSTQRNGELKHAKTTVPEGKYHVIVVDPPWPMEKIERDCRENQAGFDYPTMSEDELLAYPVPAKKSADDCHLFLWTTHKWLPFSFPLIEKWGFKYVLTMVWHKPGGFQPFGLPQYNCEFCLYARRGSPKFIDTKAFPVCFSAKRSKHSEKPEEFYALLRRVTQGPRMDVFNRREIEGFASCGNESPR